MYQVSTTQLHTHTHTPPWTPMEAELITMSAIRNFWNKSSEEQSSWKHNTSHDSHMTSRYTGYSPPPTWPRLREGDGSHFSFSSIYDQHSPLLPPALCGGENKIVFINNKQNKQTNTFLLYTLKLIICCGDSTSSFSRTCGTAHNIHNTHTNKNTICIHS